MSQAAVERVLGKLITDEPFRVRFFREPAAASFAAGLELSKAEADALSRIPVELIAWFSACLDDRICRLPFTEDGRAVSASAPDPEQNRPPASALAMVKTGHPARGTRAQRESPVSPFGAKRFHAPQETASDGAPLDRDSRTNSKE